VSTYRSATSRRREPVAIAGAITAAIPTVVGLLVAVGVLDLTPEGAEAVSTAGQQIVAGVVTVVSLVVTTWATLRARAVVTPVADPRDGSGAPLVPVDSAPRSVD
jgi:fumarate reductase subunit D